MASANPGWGSQFLNAASAFESGSQIHVVASKFSESAEFICNEWGENFRANKD